VAHHIGTRYNLFTAADEKIPLPVVDVNNKPQYLVFRMQSPHLPAKHRHLPVESSNWPCTMRVFEIQMPQDLCKSGSWLTSSALSKA
jgi:hypothetical protein